MSRTARSEFLVLAFAVAMPSALLMSFAVAPPSASFVLLLLLILLVGLSLGLHLSLLLMVAVIPNLGEIENGDLIAFLWILGFAPLATSWLLTLSLKPSRLVFPPIPLCLLCLLIMFFLIAHVAGVDLEPLANTLQGTRSPWWPAVDPFVALAIGVIAMTAISTERELKNVYLAFIYSGIPYALTIFFFGQEVNQLGIEESRSKGFYGHYHMGSIHMMVCAILAGNFAFYVKGRLRWLYIALAILYGTTLLFASSKTIVASLPILGFVWLILMVKFRTAVLTCLVISITLVLSFPILPSSLTRDISTVAQVFVGAGQPHARTLPGEGRLKTIKDRIIQVDIASRQVREEPWLGYGPGRMAYVSQIPPMYAGPQIHSYYVQIMFEIGVPGALIFLLLLFYLLVVGYANSAALRNDRLGHLVRGLFLASLMIALFLTLHSSSVGLRITWLVLGLLAATEVLVVRHRAHLSASK